ncbi:unnamed protein product [Miscanthus lutarioriparius]|uniref:Uncharacterized protein n=1 Tax=Miscanthus lutarioriparius TaxID=422564 RepID=A0A811Q8F9_9POAL|nr:unnamed protein product [Miscanthus lutarioriparius]
MATPRTTGAGTAILPLCRLLVLAAIAAYLADTMFTHLACWFVTLHTIRQQPCVAQSTASLHKSLNWDGL